MDHTDYLDLIVPLHNELVMLREDVEAMKKALGLKEIKSEEPNPDDNKQSV